MNRSNPLKNNSVIWAMELEHRGALISEKLRGRAAIRRSRRSRHTRYRQKRFERKKPQGWLAPSLMHRVLTTETWVKRIYRYAPLASLAIEKVKFDSQKLENPNIQGIEYQQGTLAGYTLREALLEHWGRECAYCGAKNLPLQIEHIQPQSKGGTNRFNNLTIACEKCNQSKGNQSLSQFLVAQPSLKQKIQNHCRKPLKDAAAVNTTRNKISEVLGSIGLPVRFGNGAWTKLTRIKANFPKKHWIDAACVATDDVVTLLIRQPLQVKCNGHGNKQYQRMNAQGFPCATPKQPLKDWKAGDIILVMPSRGKRKGMMLIGRIKTAGVKGCEITVSGKRISFNPKDAQPIHRSDGYRYSFSYV